MSEVKIIATLPECGTRLGLDGTATVKEVGPGMWDKVRLWSAFYWASDHEAWMPTEEGWELFPVIQAETGHEIICNRNSADEDIVAFVSGDQWLRQDGVWRKLADDEPTPRYHGFGRRLHYDAERRKYMVCEMYGNPEHMQSDEWYALIKHVCGCPADERDAILHRMRWGTIFLEQVMDQHPNFPEEVLRDMLVRSKRIKIQGSLQEPKIIKAILKVPNAPSAIVAEAAESAIAASDCIARGRVATALLRHPNLPDEYQAEVARLDTKAAALYLTDPSQETMAIIAQRAVEEWNSRCAAALSAGYDVVRGTADKPSRSDVLLRTEVFFGVDCAWFGVHRLGRYQGQIEPRPIPEPIQGNESFIQFAGWADTRISAHLKERREAALAAE